MYGYINLGVISLLVIFKAKGIDEVTERLTDLMVIITMGSVVSLVVEYLFGFKALDFSNWVNELSLQICRWSCICHPMLP